MKNKLDLLPTSDERTRHAFTLSLDRAAREQAKSSVEYEQELENRMLILKDNSDVISSLLENENGELHDGLECLAPHISSMSIEYSELDCLYNASEINEVSNENEHEQISEGGNNWLEGQTEECNHKGIELDEKDRTNDSFFIGINDLQDCLTMYDIPIDDSMLELDSQLEVNRTHLDYNDHCVISGVQILTDCVPDNTSGQNIQIDHKKKRGKLGRPSKKQLSKKAAIREKTETHTPGVPLSAKDARMKRLVKRRQKRHITSK